MTACVRVVAAHINLRSGVTQACRYEPMINRTYLGFARHYGIAIVPARSGRPQDKAPAEAAVLVVQRWILAALRHRRFFRLADLNAAIRELLEPLNSRPMKKLDVSRRDLFERLDRPALRPLPPTPYPGPGSLGCPGSTPASGRGH